MYQKIKKIKLINTDLIVTMDKYDKDLVINGILRSSKDTIKDIQKVVNVSEYAASRGIKEGDLVKIDLSKYIVARPLHNYGSAQERTLAPDGKKMDYSLIPPIIEIDEKPFLHIEYSDIEFVVLELEDIETGNIIVPEKKIIV